MFSTDQDRDLCVETSARWKITDNSETNAACQMIIYFLNLIRTGFSNEEVKGMCQTHVNSTSKMSKSIEVSNNSRTKCTIL